MAVKEKEPTEPLDETADLRAQLKALAAQVQALTAAQTSSGGITAAQLKEVMVDLVKVQGDAQLAAMKEIAERDMRDDLNYPRFSAYSYPEGDKKRPRPPFKCRMFWNGFDLDHDTTTAQELELLNAYDPGIYTFRRISGMPETLTVTGETNASGVLSKLEFRFPAKENRDTLPSAAIMLRDGLGLKTAEQIEIEALKAQLASLSVKAVA